jgi:hypothetical protein
MICVAYLLGRKHGQADVPTLVQELDVDGLIDQAGVQYIGKARLQPDGTWHVLANVGGALCMVEARISIGRRES